MKTFVSMMMNYDWRQEYSIEYSRIDAPLAGRDSFRKHLLLRGFGAII